MTSKTEGDLNVILVFFFSFVLASVYVVQFVMDYAEPCSLCLLIRAAMIGAAASLLMNVFFGIRLIYYGLSCLFILSGGAAALLQAWLDGCINYRCEPVPEVPLYFFGVDLAVLALAVFILALIYILVVALISRGMNRKAPPIKLNWLHRTACALIFLLSLSNIFTAIIAGH